MIEWDPIKLFRIAMKRPQIQELRKNEVESRKTTRWKWEKCQCTL